MKVPISVMSNIAECLKRQGDAEFQCFLSIAKDSVSGIKVQIYIALDQGYIDDISLKKLYESCDKVERFRGGFVGYPAVRKDGGHSTRDKEKNK
jgi:four helix bundle protein